MNFIIKLVRFWQKFAILWAGQGAGKYRCGGDKSEKWCAISNSYVSDALNPNLASILFFNECISNKLQIL